MYEIVKEFVDFQVNIRFIKASLYDFNSHFENADRVMDLRAHFLSLAISTAKLKVALCSRDCDDILKTKLMNDVLDVRKKVDQLTDDIVYVETSEEVGKQLENLSSDEAIVLAIANYNLGVIYRKNPDEKKFLYNDEEYFGRCELLLKDKRTESKTVITIMRAYKELHKIWWDLSNHIHSEYLEKILELYIEYVEQNHRIPINMAVELGIEKSCCSNNDLTEIDVIFLCSFANFMDLYALNNKQPIFVACLHRMLQHLLSSIRIFDVKTSWEWISTLCETSRYFMECERFTEAKNYIATAEYVLTNYHELELNRDEQRSEVDQTYLSARLDFMRCVIYRFWGIYGIELLASSCKVYAITDDLEHSEDLFAKKPMSPLLFTNIENSMKDSVRDIRTQVSHVHDAKKVILTVMNNFKLARETCFSATNNTVIYTNITIEMSKTYKYLAFFEKDNEKKLKLQLKRVEILNDLIDKNIASCVENRNVYIKLFLHLALANYSILDTAFDDNIVRNIINTKVYHLTDSISRVKAIEEYLTRFDKLLEK